MHKHKWKFLSVIKGSYVSNDNGILAYGKKYKCEKCAECHVVTAGIVWLHQTRGGSLFLPKWSFRK